MTVDFHTSRNGQGAALASLRSDAVDTLNAALQRNGLSTVLDPYGDTKLLDTDILQILALSSKDLDEDVRANFEKLRGVEVVYAIGD